MEELEHQKNELSIQIMKEEMAKPTLTKGQIIFWFGRLRKLDTNKLEHRRRLIDTFINTIILYDDGRIYFGCNYKDCSKTMTCAELESAGLGSDINALAAPIRNELCSFRISFAQTMKRSRSLYSARLLLTL